MRTQRQNKLVHIFARLGLILVLLAVAMVKHRDSPFHHGSLMLLRHPGDGHCTAAAAAYRDLLRRGDRTFLDMPLDALLETWQAVTLSDEIQAWLDRFHLRYLDLDASARAEASG